MGKVTSNFQELHDWLICNRPDILKLYKDWARLYQVPLGEIITWKEDRIREMMQKTPRRKHDTDKRTT